MDNQDQAEDWWLKTSGATLETWALMEAANDGSARIRFINETSDTKDEFGELNFTSIEKAIEALRRNEFRRYLEDKIIQGIWRPPFQPFQRIERPNLLCSIFWTDISVSETSILQKISAMLKKYEPGFELEGAFGSGVRGRADPNFSATREEWFRHLGLSPQNFSSAVMLAEMRDWEGDDGAEADPRINWRVTARHGDYYIHIMALDQGLSRFACCLQTSTEFEEGLESEHRSRCTLYKTGNLAEIEKILDEIYATIKRQDEQRREQDEQRREQDRIDAIEMERKIRQERLESAERKRRKLICVLVCIVVVFLIGYASSQEWISVETGFTLIIATILLVGGWYGFNEQQKKIREYNRAIDERNERKAKAQENYRIYEENYQREERAIRKRVLVDLKAVARGDKRRLDSEAVEAAKKIMERQGVNNPGMAENHPEIVKPWIALIHDLSAETLEDAKAIQDRLADLLYPETLEDVEALEKLQSEGVEKISRRERPSPENLEAAAALREIRARKERREREEAEADALERRREKERDREQAKLMDEVMKTTVRSLGKGYGLSEDGLRVLEGMPLHEAAMHIRYLRIRQKFDHLPEEEREKLAFEELERELEQERQERRKRTER
jgi:hypothetical protein